VADARVLFYDDGGALAHAAQLQRRFVIKPHSPTGLLFIAAMNDHTCTVLGKGASAVEACAVRCSSDKDCLAPAQHNTHVSLLESLLVPQTPIDCCC
jgi:hypothetical protein